MATESQHDGERQSDLAVMEANEYKQKRRLERILDAMDDVLDMSDQAWDDYVEGRISKEARNITIQRAVKNAIREAYKLLIDHHRQADSDPYWSGEDADDAIGEAGVLDDEEEIMGLRDFLESPRFYTGTVTELVSQPNKPDEPQQRPVEATMPEEVSYSAYLRLKEFLDDVHDMEIAFEEMDDDSLPLIRDFDQSRPDEEGRGNAESTIGEYNGPPDI